MVLVEASATDARADIGDGFVSGPLGGPGSLSFSFEVAGPNGLDTAVPVDIMLLSDLVSPSLVVGFGWTCASNSFPPMFYKCSAGEIISPGFYFGMTAPTPPLQTGSIFGREAWIVPNEWNESTIAASAGAIAFAPNASVSLDVTAYTALQLVIDPSFPNAANYQIVIAPEPAPWALVVGGLFALGVIRFWARRWHGRAPAVPDVAP
jgi:hypothetical protein